ncbi:MAG: glutamate--tRNA ligase [Candidatus Methanomethylophilaceae archaeon]|nr:glutamate--tRNA ligase [Candidatus Methanomethylophilaceae archaeon]
MSDNIEEIIRNYALQNAVFFKGKANPKAVVGKILGEFPDYRSKSAEIIPLINSIVEDVNSMGLEAQTKALESSNPALLAKKEKKERTYELPQLDNVNGPVVMRIAPGPSGPLHIGHTRVSILNDEYVKRYGGKLICRFEDTNPEKIDPDAYDMIPEDLEWLGVKITDYYIQSDRFELYYDITKQLIEQGNAYVCTCNADDWRHLKEAKQACPCRDLPVEEQLERYDKFMAGDYNDGEAVVVVKTAIDHPNPAVRDFVALRLVRHPHPRVGTKYIAYPMMNLSVAIDDHLMEMTHVIRGKDHLNNTFRQEYIYDYMGWKKPNFYHYGLVNIPDTMLKTSLIKKSILDGEYSGWDDVRTGTVRAMKRRGIKPEAIRRYWVESGMKAVDIQFSWDNLYGMNRDIIDDGANRYFFVQNPVRYDIDGIESISGKAPLHPDHPERGNREYTIDGAKTVFISADDSKMFSKSGKVRLKDLCNIDYGTPAKYSGDDVSILRQGFKAVQWVSRDSVEAKILMPDGTVAEGLAEIRIMDETNDEVQFERVGFVRIEKKDSNGITGIFSHR